MIVGTDEITGSHLDRPLCILHYVFNGSQIILLVPADCFFMSRQCAFWVDAASVHLFSGKPWWFNNSYSEKKQQWHYIVLFCYHLLLYQKYYLPYLAFQMKKELQYRHYHILRLPEKWSKKPLAKYVDMALIVRSKHMSICESTSMT